MNHPFSHAMEKAIQLAGNGRWHTAPNPTVGAVLVKNGQIVAEGWHHAFGQAHAEVECLKDAAARGIDPAECTLVVTLEPCNHQGKTPPCTDAILRSGIRHVVIGICDPNPLAAGGLVRLRNNGINVEVGVEQDACQELVADFLVWQTRHRPFVILKMATTLDGRIATRSGHFQWVSCDASRDNAHHLRAAVGLSGGAVLVGGNTLLMDNPLLTARPEHPQGEIRQPLAAALTSKLAGVENLQLVQKRPTETLLFTTAAGAASPLAAGLRQQGVRIFGINPSKPRAGLNLHAVLATLHEQGCPYVVCEGGGKLALALLEEGLVDEFHLYVAPKVLGDNAARPLFDGRDPLTMQEALKLRMISAELCGEDCHIVLRPQRHAGENASGAKAARMPGDRR